MTRLAVARQVATAVVPQVDHHRVTAEPCGSADRILLGDGPPRRVQQHVGRQCGLGDNQGEADFEGALLG